MLTKVPAKILAQLANFAKEFDMAKVVVASLVMGFGTFNLEGDIKELDFD